MLKDLNWHPLEQRRIDSRLVIMYKVTYDLVAIPRSEYLSPNTRQSRHIHDALAYKQIPSLKDYYNFTFSPGPLFTGMPYQPIYRFFPPWRSFRGSLPLEYTYEAWNFLINFFVICIMLHLTG